MGTTTKRSFLKIFPKSSILGALKPELKEALTLVNFVGEYEVLKLPFTDPVLLLMALNGRLTNEVSSNWAVS